MHIVNLIFSSDNNYTQHLGVVLCSIFENKSKETQYDIYVIDGGILKTNKDKLNIIEKKYLFKIKYIKINIEDYKDLFISHHITQSTYYRILIPNLLDKEIEKVIYLDCDLIISGDLSKLYETDIKNYFIAAIEENVQGIKEKLGIDNNKPYFNAGVLLINIKKWRESNISEKTISFIRQNTEKITLWDQDALNYMLQDKWLVLDRKYNLLSSEIERMKKNHENVNINPIIIHYSSSIKPWKFNGEHNFNDLYFNYLNKTPWRNNLYRYKLFRYIFLKKHKFKVLFIKIIRKYFPNK